MDATPATAAAAASTLTRRYADTYPPVLTKMPPVYVCLDCGNQPLLITSLLQVQAVIVLGGVVTLLIAMSFALFLFANKRMLRSKLFWGSNAALLLTICGIFLFLMELKPGTYPNLRCDKYIRITCARRGFTQLTPWAWSVVLLGKLWAFYPPSMRTRRHRLIIRILIVLKFRVLLDITSLITLCGLISVKHNYTFMATGLYFGSVFFDLTDNLIVSTILFKASYDFYKKARLRLSTNSRRIRLIFESIGMTFCGAIPPQLLYGLGLMISFFKPDYFSPAAQWWIPLWMFCSVGIFGILSTTWSSIGNVPNVGRNSRTSSAVATPPRTKKSTGSPPTSGGPVAQGMDEVGPERLIVPSAEDLERDQRGLCEKTPVLALSVPPPPHRRGASVGQTSSFEPTETLLSIFMVEAADAPEEDDGRETLAGPTTTTTMGGEGATRPTLIHRQQRWLQMDHPTASSMPSPRLPRR